MLATIRKNRHELRVRTAECSIREQQGTLREPPDAYLAGVHRRCGVRRDGYLAFVLAVVGELGDVDLSVVEATVGSRSFARGCGYARGKQGARGRVGRGHEDVDRLGGRQRRALRHGRVLHFRRRRAAGVRRRRVHLPGRLQLQACRRDRDRRERRARRRSAARRVAGGAPGGGGASYDAGAESEPEPSSWERPLRALIDAPAAQAAGSPLAIELELHSSGPAGAGPPRLLAKLMREGARGGWINGSLTWSGLESWQVQNGDYRPDHLALVRELYAVHRTRLGRASYHYSYGHGADKTLDLGACDSVQLWSLLDEADRLGVKLIHTFPGLGEVPRWRSGELLIDVTRGDGQSSIVGAVLRIDGEDGHGLAPLLFIGADGHGLVCGEGGEARSNDRPDSRRLRLVRLERPAPAALQRMVLGGERLNVPAGELQRFAEEVCPGAAPRRRGGLLRRLLHAAGDLRTDARAARKLRPGPRR